MIHGVNLTTSVILWLKSLTSDPVTSLAWVRSTGDALVFWRGGKESSTGSFQERWLGNSHAYIIEILLKWTLNEQTRQFKNSHDAEHKPVKSLCLKNANDMIMLDPLDMRYRKSER